MHELIGWLFKGFAIPRRTMMPMMEPFFLFFFFYGTVKTTCCHAVIAEQERRPMLEKQAWDPGTSTHTWKNFDWKHCCLSFWNQSQFSGPPTGRENSCNIAQTCKTYKHQISQTSSVSEKTGGSNVQMAPELLLLTALTASETPETQGSLIILTLHLTDSSSRPTSTAANYCSVSEQSSSGS